MHPFDAIMLIAKIGAFLAILFFFMVRYRNKNKGIVDDAVDIELSNTPRGCLILRHRKYWGKIQLTLENEILEEFDLPKISLKTKFTMNPKVVRGINEIVITRPLVAAGLSGGWRYQILGDKKNVDVVV